MPPIIAWLQVWKRPESNRPSVVTLFVLARTSCMPNLEFVLLDLYPCSHSIEMHTYVLNKCVQ